VCEEEINPMEKKRKKVTVCEEKI